MATPSEAPPLSRALCFSQSTLLSFLNNSRSLIDDSISTNLNALSTPSRSTGSSSSSIITTTSTGSPSPDTSIRQPHPSQRQIPHAACNTFITSVLFPSWQTREQVLDYCSAVAQAPDDLDDPDAAAREAYNRAGEARLQRKNERLDPYSGRFFPEKSRGEQLAEFCERERVIEDIVRERSWDVVRSRCDVDIALARAHINPAVPSGSRHQKLYARAFDQWRSEQSNPEGSPSFEKERFLPR